MGKVGSGRKDVATEGERSIKRTSTLKGSFKRLNNVLDAITARLGLDKRLREHTMISLWPVLIGEPWGSRSRGLFFDAEGSLVVAVKDASTGQELSLLKPRILEKLRASGRAMGIVVKGLRFDLKRFHADLSEENSAHHLSPTPLREPDYSDLSSIQLTNSDLRQIEELRHCLSSSSQLLGISVDRIADLVEQELKLKQWQRANGYPACRICGEPTPHLHGRQLLCSPCYLKSL